MAKWYGVIGYAVTEEVKPGVWKEQITERRYFGDLTRNARKLQNSGFVNDNVTITNDISVVADPYAIQNFHAIRYVEFLGTKWKISSVDVQYPRLNLTLGEVYNGEQA